MTPLRPATTHGLMNPGSDLGEYQRIGVLVARKSESLATSAREGYAAHGSGAVFYCDAWQETLPKATLFYLPASEPEFADVGEDIERSRPTDP